MSRGDVFVLDCAKEYPSAPQPDEVAAGLKSLIEDHPFLLAGPIIMGDVTKVEQNGSVVRIYTSLRDNYERGSYQGGEDGGQ